MSFDKYAFRKEVINRLKKTSQHFSDISDIVNHFIGKDENTKKDVERELIHLARNMHIIDIKEWNPNAAEKDENWLEAFKKSHENTGDKIEGLYAGLTKDYFVIRRQKMLYYLCFAVLAAVLIIWAIDHLLTKPA